MTSSFPSRRHLLFYSLLALPLSFAGLPLYIHVPDFYMRDLGLDIGVAGTILLAIRLFDALQDPVIGYVSDKRARHRFFIVTFGVITLCVGMAGVCYGPYNPSTTAMWFACSMVLATTGFSIITINLTTIGGLWSDDPAQRTRISGWRETFALVGLLIASVLPPFLQTQYSAEGAFRILFWVFVGIALGGFLFFFRFMRQISLRDTVSVRHEVPEFSFIAILKGPNCSFFGVCFLSHLAAAVSGATVLFFVRDYLQAEGLSGLFLLLYFISGAVFMAIWIKLAARVGKESAWIVAMCLAIATFMWAFFLSPGHVIPYTVICVLSGVSFGADLALPPALLADRIAEQGSEPQATQHYAVLAFIPKTAFALASGCALLLLDRLSFVAGGYNTSDALQGVIILYALVPCLMKLLAVLVLWHLSQERRRYA